MASLSLYPQFETNLMSNRKVIELLLQLKNAKAHGKNYIKVRPSWSAISGVIVCSFCSKYYSTPALIQTKTRALYFNNMLLLTNCEVHTAKQWEHSFDVLTDKGIETPQTRLNSATSKSRRTLNNLGLFEVHSAGV